MPTILERLSDTVESLAELRVITGVGSVKLDITVGGTSGPTVTPSQSSANVSGIYSEVNLITGDIVTLIDSEFNDPNNPTLEFHKTQVENGRQIVTANINTIIRLIQAAGDKLDLGKTSTRQVQTPPTT
jgi:hypothetical protein